MSNTQFELQRDSYGRLVLTTQNGERHEGVTPVRAFPIAAPDEGLSLVNYEGHEVGWVERTADLPPAIGQLIEEELASREFVPEIRAINAISSYVTPSTWQVDTDRGSFCMVLESEDDIRRISRTMLMISDSNGIQFLVRDLSRLDRSSRKLLDGFL